MLKICSKKVAARNFRISKEINAVHTNLIPPKVQDENGAWVENRDAHEFFWMEKGMTSNSQIQPSTIRWTWNPSTGDMAVGTESRHSSQILSLDKVNLNNFNEMNPEGTPEMNSEGTPEMSPEGMDPEMSPEMNNIPQPPQPPQPIEWESVLRGFYFPAKKQVAIRPFYWPDPDAPTGRFDDSDSQLNTDVTMAFIMAIKPILQAQDPEISFEININNSWLQGQTGEYSW